MIIAVDGPTASGKGTIAKALARHYGRMKNGTTSMIQK